MSPEPQSYIYDCSRDTCNKMPCQHFDTELFTLIPNQCVPFPPIYPFLRALHHWLLYCLTDYCLLPEALKSSSKQSPFQFSLHSSRKSLNSFSRLSLIIEHLSSFHHHKNVNLLSFVYCIPLSPVCRTVPDTQQAYNKYLFKKLMHPMLKYHQWLPIT